AVHRWETRVAATDAAPPLRSELHGPSGDLPGKPRPGGARRRAWSPGGRPGARTLSAERARDLPARLESPLSGRQRPDGERRGRGARRVGPHGTHVAQRVLGVVEARDLDDVARVRSVDELARADVHPFVLRAVRARVKEPDVSRLQLVDRDP